MMLGFEQSVRDSFWIVLFDDVSFDLYRTSAR